MEPGTAKAVPGSMPSVRAVAGPPCVGWATQLSAGEKGLGLVTNMSN